MIGSAVWNGNPSLGAGFGLPGLSARETFTLAAQLPPATTKPVDFARDIKPIFDTSCIECHAHGKAKGSGHYQDSARS